MKESKVLRISLFIHRRDFRVVDNTALNKLINLKDPNSKIFHLFIFNSDQIDPLTNTYFSKNSVEFLVQSLESLNIQLLDGLHCFYGKDIEVLSQLIKDYMVSEIAFNLDYTPFARSRDENIIQWCKEKGIICITTEDYTLFPINSILTDEQKAYEVFTPFYNKCINNIFNIRSPADSLEYEIYRDKQASGILKNIHKFYFNDPNPNLALKGGRPLALFILKNRIAKGEFKNYEKFRDYPSMNKTTKLSPYIKYGCVSIREVFLEIKRKYGVKHGLVRELLWREFYANIAYAFPKVLHGQIGFKNQAFRDKYNNIAWKLDKRLWDAFVVGKTGYPMVDAGIRQLITTGWCHNRSRMIIAMFASKDLHFPLIDVERWFASKLIDYDPCSNSGGVQWAYGIGSDAQPYFRIFNPLTQGIKYDKDVKYILTYVPELKHVNVQDIHTWDISWKNYKVSYPKPIINHNNRVKIVKMMFSKD